MSRHSENQRNKILVCVALGFITFALYFPAGWHDFIQFDDQEYVTENAEVQAGLTLKSTVWAFGFHASNWHPLTWLSHMVDCQLFGLSPAGHHLTSVALHVINTLLIFLVLNSLTSSLWRSAGVAALFGWHPLHVESVAWIAERKDVLSTCFLLLALWAYARYAQAAETQNAKSTSEETSLVGHRVSLRLPASACFYLLALLLFSLALMSKPMVVTLPFLLLLVDYWPLQRFRGLKISPSGILVEKIPFFMLSVAACVLTISAQGRGHAIVSTASLSMAQRVGHGLLAYGHYLGTIFLPRHLAVYYPYELESSTTRVILAASVVGFGTLGALRFVRSYPYLIVGWLWFLGTLVPVIGLVQVGDQAWADRYTYLPSVGIFVGIVWGFADFVTKKNGIEITKAKHNALVWVPGIVLGLALLLASSFQLAHWKNTSSLFAHAAQVTRHNHVAVTLLGSLMARDGKIEAAIENYRTALLYRPEYAEAHFFLGNAYEQQGKLSEAIGQYLEAIRFKPLQEQARLGLGRALAKQGNHGEAAIYYNAVLKLNPGSAIAHNNLARLLHVQGKLDEAMNHYAAAIRLDPGLAQAHNNLGVLLLQKGDPSGAIAQLHQALRLNPNNAESEYNLALALNQLGRWSESEPLFSRTVNASFSDPKALCQFGLALAHLHKTREAMAKYATALLLQADFPDALTGLAWILATSANSEFRNGPEAVRMAERACDLTGRKDPDKLKTLAAAFAEAGLFQQAVGQAQAAMDLAATAGRPELAQECGRLLETFKSDQPWRESK